MFCLCLYSLVSLGSPLHVFEAHVAFLGMTLAMLWLPWDAGVSLWGALGSQGALLRISLAFLWLPFEGCGHLWATLGSQPEFEVTLDQKWIGHQYFDR